MVGHGVPGLPPWAFESDPFGAFGEKVLWEVNSQAKGSPRTTHSFGRPSFSRNDFRSFSSFDFFLSINPRAFVQVFWASSVRPSLA